MNIRSTIAELARFSRNHNKFSIINLRYYTFPIVGIEYRKANLEGFTSAFDDRTWIGTCSVKLCLVGGCVGGLLIVRMVLCHERRIACTARFRKHNGRTPKNGIAIYATSTIHAADYLTDHDSLYKQLHSMLPTTKTYSYYGGQLDPTSWIVMFLSSCRLWNAEIQNVLFS